MSPEPQMEPAMPPSQPPADQPAAGSGRAIYPVVLSGGAGSRLWPLSRRAYPKQFLPLNGELSLLSETLRRVADGRQFAAPTIVCNAEHRFLVAEHARLAEVAVREIVLEPVARNTAPAVAVACLRIAAEAPDADALILPSDHVIADLAALHRAVAVAARASGGSRFMTFGVEPGRAETAYGYVELGAPLPDAEGAFAVAAFHEKPDSATAERYLASGRFLWNAGLFLFPVGAVLQALRAHAPDVLAAAERAVAGAVRDLDFLRLDEAGFAAAPSISIDHALMERTDRAGIVPVSMGWSDLGGWETFWTLAPKDADGNALDGRVVAIDCQGAHLRSTGRLVAALGVQDLLVVETDDAVAIAPRARSEEVKLLVERLRRDGFPEADQGSRDFRPWGWFRRIADGDRFQVKHIQVSPGASLSLQLHHHRAEHWIVVRGTARVIRGDAELLLQENESTYIQPGTRHRLENPGRIPLEVIEVQSGAYLGEDDIVRFTDDYGRD